MVSRNQLLGQMRRPRTDEENLKEFEFLRYKKHLDPRQENRLEELKLWHEGYLKSLEEPFAAWAFHRSHGKKIFYDEEKWLEALENGWVDAIRKLKKTETPKDRQKLIDKQWQEETGETEDKSFDKDGYLLFLQRSISKTPPAGEKVLYHYKKKELMEAYKKLGVEVDESLGRIDLYKQLKIHIELNAN